jgi:(1->4)-alpha-D-glucan 1-alpha-D-glucosylmutase
MLKAVREAKVHSSWLNSNTEYENSLSGFIRALLAPGNRNVFIADFLPFQRLISRLGMLNSLSQTLIKLTSPGVPDIYQGNELWDFSLVDPDNRGAVDYTRRRIMLDELKAFVNVGPHELAERVSGLLHSMEDGKIKLYLIWKTLMMRSQFVGLFCKGDYLPLRTEGARAEHICAFARVIDEHAVIVVAPRLFYTLVGEDGRLPIGAAVWEDTSVEIHSTLGKREWTNAFTGEALSIRAQEGRCFASAADLFANFPYALLVSQ